MTTPGGRHSRRAFLGLASGAGLVTAIGLTGCDVSTAGTTGQVLPSQLAVPTPFRVPLPIPDVARPSHSGRHGEFYEITQRAARQEIIPGTRTTVWGYDGTFPGPTFHARSGQRTMVRVRNRLRVPTSTHLHGGVTPPESDGYPTDLVMPPGVGYDPRNRPGSHGGMHVATEDWVLHEGTKDYEYPLVQRAANLWYHDHRMDFSGPQVWRGLAGMFRVTDRDEDRLPLPDGDRDVPLMVCDRAFDASGEFRYPSVDPSLTGEPGVHPDYMAGVLGDVILVNGAPWPRMEVSNTLYRFRILNASNARRYRFALTPPPRGTAAFTQVGSGHGLLEAPVRHNTLTVAPAERFDTVIDFSRYPVGTQVTLHNTLGDGDTTRVMRFDVVRSERDEATIPQRLSTPEHLDGGQVSTVREFDFRQTTVDGMRVWTINGQPFDTTQYLAEPPLGAVELWRFTSDFHHPVHTHLVHFQVLTRNGAPPLGRDAGWKDTVDVRPYEVVEVLARFRGFRGRYMLHCHNLEHEDMAMMGNFRVR